MAGIVVRVMLSDGDYIVTIVLVKIEQQKEITSCVRASVVHFECLIQNLQKIMKIDLPINKFAESSSEDETAR